MVQQSVSRLYLCSDHYKLLLPIGILYDVVNYHAVKASGIPLYWFMTWEDYKTPLICLLLKLIFILVWIALAKLN